MARGEKTQQERGRSARGTTVRVSRVDAEVNALLAAGADPEVAAADRAIAEQSQCPWDRAQAVTLAKGIVSRFEQRLRTTAGNRESGRAVDAAEVKAAGIIDQDEQRVLVAAAQYGYKRAEDLLVFANMRLIHQYALKNHYRGDLAISDLVAEGIIGVKRGIPKYRFDTKATPLSVFRRWIDMQQRRESDDSGHTVRMPVHVHERLTRLRNARKALEAQQIAEPTFEQLLDMTNKVSEAKDRITPELLSELIELESRRSISLDKPIGNGDASENTYGGAIPDETVDIPRLAITAEAMAKVREMVDMIPEEKLRTVLFRGLGFDGHEPMEQKELGAMLGLTVSQVEGLKRRAMNELHKAFIAEGFESADDLLAV